MDLPKEYITFPKTFYMAKLLGSLLLLALLIAFFTAPSAEKFTRFAVEKTSSAPCKPAVDYQSYKIIFPLFGIGHMRPCKSATGIYDQQTGQRIGNANVPVYGDSQTYLGLFGRFWKL